MHRCLDYKFRPLLRRVRWQGLRALSASGTMLGLAVDHIKVLLHSTNYNMIVFGQEIPTVGCILRENLIALATSNSLTLKISTLITIKWVPFNLALTSFVKLNDLLSS